MADHELHTRTYENGVTAELRLDNGRWRFRVLEDVDQTLQDWSELPHASDVEFAVNFVDVFVDRKPLASWKRVLECYACLLPDVPIHWVQDKDAYDVDCPSCRQYRTTGPAVAMLGKLRDSEPKRLADLAEHLRTRVLGSEADTVDTDSWLWMADQGKALRRKRLG